MYYNHFTKNIIVTNGINANSINTVWLNFQRKSTDKMSRFKIDHSNHIYDKWCSKSTQEVHS
jgi:hypothetical protein